ncbi:MAG: hypothetical protein HRT71_17630 [Flavobacteriales bacterium]|nr:hypothetical protein [Flavobacteriales bacterium]
MIDKYKVYISDFFETQRLFKNISIDGKKHTILVVPGKEGGMSDEAKGVDMIALHGDRVHKLAVVVPSAEHVIPI